MIEQRSPEWFAMRAGCATGSMITAVLAEGAGKEEATTRRNYRYQLALERITGDVQPTHETWDMKQGVINEPTARGWYEGETGILVEEAPFIKHPTIEWLGASPDGKVPGGLVEIKCPKPAIHMNYIITEKIPYIYKAQMVLQMMCTGEPWCDFVSFSPIMPEELKYLCVRYYPEPALKSEITIKTMRFLSEVKRLVTDMETMRKDRS
jgi:putative phage-type endonuclease